MVRAANQFDQEQPWRKLSGGRNALVRRGDALQLFSNVTKKIDGLLRLIGREITRGNNHTLPIDPVKCLAMMLRFLATGSSYTSIAHSYRTSKSTVSSIVYEVSNALWKFLQPLYLASPSGADWINIAGLFHDLWNFPNCIGAMESTLPLR